MFFIRRWSNYEARNDWIWYVLRQLLRNGRSDGLHWRSLCEGGTSKWVSMSGFLYSLLKIMFPVCYAGKGIGRAFMKKAAEVGIGNSILFRFVGKNVLLYKMLVSELSSHPDRHKTNGWTDRCLDGQLDRLLLDTETHRQTDLYRRRQGQGQGHGQSCLMD